MVIGKFQKHGLRSERKRSYTKQTNRQKISSLKYDTLNKAKRMVSEQCITPAIMQAANEAAKAAIIAVK